MRNACRSLRVELSGVEQVGVGRTMIKFKRRYCSISDKKRQVGKVWKEKIHLVRSAKVESCCDALHGIHWERGRGVSLVEAVIQCEQ